MSDAPSASFEITHSGALRLLVTHPPAASRRAVFLDRDGVINRRIVGGYVTKWSEFEFLPGAMDGIVRLATRDGPIIVVSNQAGVGKGLVAVSDLAEITSRFVAAIQERGGRIDAVYYCPHTPADDCECRKRKPGLIVQAASDWQLDLRASVMLGDSESDAAAGRAAGCAVILASRASEMDAAWRQLSNGGGCGASGGFRR